MPYVKCAAKKCIWNKDGACNVDGQIDIDNNGSCMDCDELTAEEHKLIVEEE